MKNTLPCWRKWIIMYNFMFQSDYQTKIIFLSLFMLGNLLLVTLFFRLFDRFEKESKHLNWGERIWFFVLLESCSLFLLETIFLAKETDWNGWFAKKFYIPDINIYKIMVVGLPTYLLFVFSLISLIGGFYLILCPLFSKGKQEISKVR